MLCIFLSVALLVNSSFYIVVSEERDTNSSFRRIRGASWGFDVGLLNYYLGGLGFDFSLPPGAFIGQGTKFALPGGYLLQFEQSGDDKLATVYDKALKAVAVLKILRDGKVVVNMYHGNFSRMINFLGPSEVEVKDTDGSENWQLNWKAIPGERNEAIMLLRKPREQAVKVIKSYLETWHGFGPEALQVADFEVVGSVITDKNYIIRARQDKDNADIVDVDSIAVYDTPDGQKITVLAFWDELSKIPQVVLYRGNVVFDWVKKASEDEQVRLLDQIIDMARRGVVPADAILVSEWKDYTYRGRALHRGATIASLMSTAAVLWGTWGIDPTNLWMSAVVGGSISYILYKALKSAMVYGIKQVVSTLMNIERLNNLYPASETFLTKGIQREGGFWVRYNLLAGKPDGISESITSIYRDLEGSPNLPAIANGNFYMSLGSDSFSYGIRLKEIYAVWLVSKMFPAIPQVLTNRNQLDTRNLGWKWMGHDWWAQVVSTGITHPLTYTDVGLYGAYAIPADCPIYQGDKLVANNLNGKTDKAVFEERKTELVGIKTELETALTKVNEDMRRWSGVLKIFTRYFDQGYRKLQVDRNVLEEKIKLLNNWIGEIDGFSKAIAGQKPAVKAFDWIFGYTDKGKKQPGITDPAVKQAFINKLAELGIPDPENISLLELYNRFPILKNAQEVASFIETGILVFKDGQWLDPHILPGLRGGP
jgi:hypothetical protein